MNSPCSFTPNGVTEEGITLDESFLSTCMWCGGRIKNQKSIYDFYCSIECEAKDNERINELISEGEHPTTIMNEAFRKVTKKKGVVGG